MEVKKYLKDKSVELITTVIVLLITIWLLVVFKVNPVGVALITGLFLVSGISIFIYDYNHKKKFYNSLMENVSRMDKAYIVLETLEKPEFLEGKILYDILYEIDKSMAENVAMYQKQGKDFSEYIELWLHEVKLPLSAISLKLHNLLKLENNTRGSNDFSAAQEYKKLLAETRRIEMLVNQILYYVRSGSAEKDYHISKVSVADIIHDTAMTYRESLQDNGVDFLIENGDLDLNQLVINTDSKWLVFIMGQLISNSIKYKKESQSYVKIKTSLKDGGLEIIVEDNGIGIPKEDLKRVFDKSFTGFNGRNMIKSTGMGLYIVKELCGKLGHDISLESEQGEWTRVSIFIKNNEFYDVV